jgi:MYXO-CTERM domain-containing protein
LRAAGPWSDWRRFQLSAAAGTAPDAPEPRSPAAGETAGARPEFSVRNIARPAGAGEVAYDVQVAEDEAFRVVVGGVDGVPEGPGGVTVLAVDGLELAPGEYWWRARAIVDGEPGPWSEPVPFTVGQVDAPSGRRTRSAGMCATGGGGGGPAAALLVLLPGLRRRRRRR